MPNIIDATKAALQERGFALDAVSFSTDETDIGRFSHRIDAHLSVVATGAAELPRVDFSVAGVDPVSGRTCRASVVHLGTVLDSHRGFVTTFDFAIVYGD